MSKRSMIESSMCRWRCVRSRFHAGSDLGRVAGGSRRWLFRVDRPRNGPAHRGWPHSRPRAGRKPNRAGGLSTRLIR